jgi:alpha-1,3-rhamnosyl/mannosyltransferase
VPAARVLTPPHRAGLVIGIDARAAVEVPAGRGRVVRELLRALAARDDPHRYLLYAREPWEGVEDPRMSWRTTASGDPWWHMRTARAATREADVFLSTNSYLTTWFLGIPGVPIVYDLVVFDREMRPNRRAAAIERLTIGPAVRRSAGFLAISQTTADALVERFPRAADRITVAPLGPAPLVLATASGALPEPGFVLAVGTLEPRKNLPRLVDAYRSLPHAVQAEHPLVVVGTLGWETGETLDALRSLGNRCHLLGYVTDADLVELYRRCEVFCYPSLGEGFGLPVLEAMAVGAPVVTSSVSSLPEVGGDAVEYADPRDPRSIAAALRRVLDDPGRRQELSERAVARARTFTWDRFAEQTLDALSRASRSPL